MSNSTNSSSGGGIGICGMTFIVFLVLKLLGHITWSWWWVTSPLWISTGLVVIIIIIILLIAFLVNILR